MAVGGRPTTIGELLPLLLAEVRSVGDTISLSDVLTTNGILVERRSSADPERLTLIPLVLLPPLLILILPSSCFELLEADVNASAMLGGSL